MHVVAIPWYVLCFLWTVRAVYVRKQNVLCGNTGTDLGIVPDRTFIYHNSTVLPRRIGVVRNIDASSNAPSLNDKFAMEIRICGIKKSIKLRWVTVIESIKHVKLLGVHSSLDSHEAVKGKYKTLQAKMVLTRHIDVKFLRLFMILKVPRV